MVHLNLQDRALALPVFRGRIGPELAASQRRYRTAMKSPEEQVMNEARRQVETPVDARAGFLDRPVLVVLCVSLALGIVVLGALWFGFFAPSA
jgi:hypothetical protein